MLISELGTGAGAVAGAGAGSRDPGIEGQIRVPPGGSQNRQILEMEKSRAAAAPLLKYSHINLSSYEHSLEVTTAQTWNGLKPEYRNIVDISNFKLTMKFLLDHKIQLYKD